MADTDAWRENKTLASLLRTSRQMREFATLKPVEKFKAELEKGRDVATAVIETVFRGRRFSSANIWWADSNITQKTSAATPALAFQSPELRSAVFNDISRRDNEHRMIGYSSLARLGGLLKTDEAARMDRDALNLRRRLGRFCWPAR